jgi:hypothetical protein
MRRAFRLVLERLDDDGLDLVVADLARRAASRLIAQAVESVLGEALAPCAYGLTRHADLGGDRHVVEPLGGRQHDRGALRLTPRHLAAAGEALQIGALAVAELDRAGLPCPMSPPESLARPR